ncbi:BatD family protein [Rapidithrix thailandica]|uniref:BatD family protein n=1 Tax=Rapidithrix thailandica TaxID=413964 RepID=A0AAW9S8Y2_9BACT
MLKSNKFWFLVITNVFVPWILAWGQGVSVELGNTEIGSNQMFQITITIENERLKEYSGFPEIPGFRKSGTSSSSSTNIVNNKVSMSQSIIQNYYPTGEGTFTLKPFTITINGKEARSSGATIKVGAPISAQKSDPFADFWGFGKRNENKEFVDVKEDAFFAISTNKNEVYVGEGFTTSIAFYVSLKNKARMDFYKVGDQLTEILKKVKPSNCWEENFGVESINPEYVTINGKQYRQYKIYEASFYPLNQQTIKIPSVGLKMVKYKESKTPSFFGRDLKEDYKVFYSAPKTVRVKELPTHPLRDQVSVGDYRLEEKLGSDKFRTGRSFVYEFKIKGEGNISAIKEPKPDTKGKLTIYPPSINQKINRANGTVYGTKNIQYFIEPQEPGEYHLGDAFQWVYFNSRLKKYDTLRSELAIQVTGESKKNSYIASNDMGSFYSSLETESNELQSLQEQSWMRYVTYAGVTLLLIFTGIIVFKK